MERISVSRLGIGDGIITHQLLRFRELLGHVYLSSRRYACDVK